MATAELIVEREQDAAQAWRVPAQIPELDGVRGLAILLVMICHSSMWLPDSPVRTLLLQGKVGVDLFFVLSGFLITGILLDTRERPRALRNFYVRRGLRIWPLYFAFVFVAFTIPRRMIPPDVTPWVYALCIQNFICFASMGPLLDPLWSLAVEEQFYLFWPWIALRVRRQTVLRICCVVLAFSPMIRCLFRAAGASPEFVYSNTLCRLDGIAMGGMIAAWIRDREFAIDALQRLVRAAPLAGTLGLALTYAVVRTRLAIELQYSFVALIFGGLLALVLLEQSTASTLARAFRSSSLGGLGRISFALYLFNLPIYTIAHGVGASRWLSHLPKAMAGAAVLVASNLVLLAAASLSWKFFESPILGLKSRLAPRAS